MVLNALRGALSFLTRLPVGGDEADFAAFATTPAAFPAAGYVLGALLAVPVLLLDPVPVAAGAYLLAVYLLTGVSHADGLADLGDAAAVHDRDGRREALKDTTVGVGAVLALSVGVVALALGAVGAASLPVGDAVALVIVAEVGAKFAMATVACLGEAAHEGLGSTFTREADPALLLGPVVVALPAAALTFPSPAGLAALLAAFVVAVAVTRWAGHALGGVNGDVFGAVNELARIAALHAGVFVWLV